jgi:hypothetical protein
MGAVRRRFRVDFALRSPTTSAEFLGPTKQFAAVLRSVLISGSTTAFPGSPARLPLLNCQSKTWQMALETFQSLRIENYQIYRQEMRSELLLEVGKWLD